MQRNRELPTPMSQIHHSSPQSVAFLTIGPRKAEHDTSHLCLFLRHNSEFIPQLLFRGRQRFVRNAQPSGVPRRPWDALRCASSLRKMALAHSALRLGAQPPAVSWRTKRCLRVGMDAPSSFLHVINSTTPTRRQTPAPLAQYCAADYRRTCAAPKRPSKG